MAKNRGEPQKMSHSSKTEFFFGMVRFLPQKLGSRNFFGKYLLFSPTFILHSHPPCNFSSVSFALYPTDKSMKAEQKRIDLSKVINMDEQKAETKL